LYETKGFWQGFLNFNKICERDTGYNLISNRNGYDYLSQHFSMEKFYLDGAHGTFLYSNHIPEFP
jgi:hypothetical protein